MQQAIDRKEAVRLARETLGEAPVNEIMAYVEREFGLKVNFTAVMVTLGNLQERSILDASSKAAAEELERWKLENPAEAKKLAATARRREAMRLKKEAEKAAAMAAEQAAEAIAESPVEPAGGVPNSTVARNAATVTGEFDLTERRPHTAGRHKCFR
jgi:hypothetical protein